ncbi:MAG TPA: tetratricopeptide repeat protein, partial [Kineosporiaceae bacterium]|nr:tetratricopeptide repeat protein [Kineosporiaceae bacterium]
QGAGQGAAPGASPAAVVTIDGVPAEDGPLRDALERSYRDLAALTPAGDERVALVDRANTVRRWTLR